MKPYFSIFLITLLAISCNTNEPKNSDKDILGNWTAIKITSSNNDVPGYLVSDLTINFKEDSTYSGKLDLLQLPNNGGFSINRNHLILSEDTFNIVSHAKDTLYLTYTSFSIPFEIQLITTP